MCKVLNCSLIKYISGNEEEVGDVESINSVNDNLDANISSFSGSDIQNLSDLSQELTLTTTDMDTEGEFNKIYQK